MKKGKRDIGRGGKKRVVIRGKKKIKDKRRGKKEETSKKKGKWTEERKRNISIRRENK